MLRAIAGLDIQTAGLVEQAGKDISALPPSERDFGIVFQSYALFPNLTVQRNIAYGLENAGKGKAEITKRVGELLELVGMPDQGPKYPSQLSGGQQQRVALARALATSPGLLLLDEPLSALDAKVRVHLRHEVKLLQEQLGVTTIMVTHDQEEALAMADRIVVMNHGVIEQVGTPTEIYRQPANLFVADFIGEMNQLEGTLQSKDKVKVGGVSLACSSAGLNSGDSGVVTIRPEDIVPVEASGKSGPKNAPKNVLQAEIAELEFLGAFWRAWLANDKIGEAGLKANFSINAARRLDLKIGKKVKVALPPEHVRVFQRRSA